MSKVKIVLRADVPNVGSAGDVASVAGGYARNYLIPRGLAAAATRGAIKESEAMLAGRAGRAQRETSAAEALRAALEARPLQVKAQAGPDGRLFGSVTAAQIVDTAKGELGFELDRHDVVVADPIRHLGFHEVKVRLHPSVTATVIVEVVE